MIIGDDLKRNLKMSELQKKVDDLQRLYKAAVELRADNKHQIKWDLERAEKRLAEHVENT